MAALPLHDLKNVNTVIGMLYDSNGVYRAAFEPAIFYNTILLDSLKYGEENYVHLKYTETISIRKGEHVARFRRWAGLTPTLTPLKEGIPPMPDKHAYETIEVGNVFSFGRWSEYTDRVDLSIINEVIAERSVQYGEVANQTKELYARKTWLSAPNEFYANFKAGFKDIAFGDEVTLDDLRFLVARMKRMMVKPIAGKFNYICSSEFINGLIDDPRVKQYMEIEQTTGKLWTSGQPFDMFELSFIPTMLDEFAYPDTEYPGVYEKADGKEVIRLYAIAKESGVDYIYYLDVHQDFIVKGTTQTARTTETFKYLKDGSVVENHVGWEIAVNGTLVKSATNTNTAISGLLQLNAEATEAKCTVAKVKREVDRNIDGSPKFTYTPQTITVNAALADVISALVAGGEFLQLPVHRGILFGMEAIIKLNMEGVSDAPKIIVKALGSSGVADPIDQRQSIGFKVDGFGLAIKRPEAIVVTYGIPKFAELAALTSNMVYRDFTLMDGAEVNADGVQTLRVDGVNLGGIPGKPVVRGKKADGSLNVVDDGVLEPNPLDGANKKTSNVK